MRMREWPGAALAPLLVIGSVPFLISAGLFLIGAVLFPAVAAGQVTLGQLIPPVEKAAPKPPEGFYVTPSLSVGQLYDDNLFFSSTNRRQDFFTRVSPGIQAGYQSTPFTFMGGYTSDSEFYSKHTELTTLQMRQRALFDLKVMSTESLRFSATGTYSKTNAPWELNTFTGVALVRVRADRLALDPSISYRFDPLTTAKGDFTISRDRMVNAISINSALARVSLDRRISSTDTVAAGYTGRRFEFDNGNTITSHAPLLGWEHKFSPLTTLTLRAGPRFTEGSLDDRPEALASIQHLLPQGEVSLAYANMQTTVIGQPFSVMAESVRLTAKYKPLPHFEVAVEPSVARITSEGFKATVYISNVDLTYHFTKELALRGTHQYSLMRGDLDPATGSAGGTVEVPHNMFWLRLVVTYPFRVD
jgi:hypothetical protein